jgi:hypothetical protein
MESIKRYFTCACVAPVKVGNQDKFVVYSDDSSCALILGMGDTTEQAIANGVHTVNLMAAVGSI